MACDIKVGSKGANVIKLQKFLSGTTYQGGKPYYRGKIDADYGNLTKGATSGKYIGGVALWQYHHKLKPDGYAGPITTARMGIRCAVSVAPKPATPTVKPLPTPVKYDMYLVPTKNCPVSDPSIVALAKQITQGCKSKLEEAKAIFVWVRDVCNYEYYYNTRYGCLGTLRRKAGNCTDLAHLEIALFRARQIPARYWHIDARFTSGISGHTCPQCFVDGKWYNADPTNNGNLFGSVKWTVVKDKGTMAECYY